MENIALLTVCFVLGILARRLNYFPVETPRAFNAFILHVSLPAMVFFQCHRLQIQPALIFAAITPWFVFAAAWGFFCSIRKVRFFSSETLGALILTAGLGNTAFVGLPMVEAFYGKSALPTALVVDQLGSFFALSLLGPLAIARYSQSRISGGAVLRKLVFFPPFIALILSVGLRSVEFPETLNGVLQRLSATLAPLALFSVGFQLRPEALTTRWRALGVGLFYKLVCAPIGVALLLVLAKVRGQVGQVAIFEAAMAPMITGAIVATENNLDPTLSNLMVGIGIPLSFVTLPLVNRLIHRF